MSIAVLLAVTIWIQNPQKPDKIKYPVNEAEPLTYVIDYEPFWSPDGKKVALISNRHGGLKLHILDTAHLDDGGYQMKQLTFGKTEEDSPAWSPNGKEIAFVSIRDGVSQICVMDSDGKNIRQITTGKYDNIHPAWTPDSKRIMFNTSRYLEENKKARGLNPGHPTIGEPQDNFIDLASVARDGSDWKLITKGGGYTYAFYSSDGTKIVYRRSIGETSQVWLMNSDGSGDHNLSGDENQDGWPSWDPAGKRICFVRRGKDGKLNIFVMNADGSGAKQITDLMGDSTNPRWSPNGKTILFTRRLGGICPAWVPAPRS